jgi:anionic cell wall polymer biosynthesis LytR-Cps2A-Psr (LCP) family protein
MLLAYIDTAKKQLTLIHIPRDIWVSLPTGDTPVSAKINAALALGTKSSNYPTKDVGKDAVIRGSYLSRQAVKQVTGLTGNFVIGIDFNGFAGAINALRGIDVAVAKTLNDPWYPIKGKELELCGKTPEEVTILSNTLSGFALEKEFPCRYEPLYFEPGVTPMDGDTVLKYVRSRHSTSDFDRGIRQQEVLIAIMKKLIKLKSLETIPSFFSTLGRAVKTDLTENNITEAAVVLAQLPNYKLTTIGLSTANVLQSTTTKTGASALLPKAGEGNW